MLTGQGIELPVVSFESGGDVTLMPTSGGQIGRAELVDLDLDGSPDYATASTSINGSAVSFFIASGESFNKTGSFAVNENYFEDIAYGDINGDGLPDVIAAAQNAVHTYLNQGVSAGGDWLGMEPHEEIKLKVSSLAVGDLNDDGRDDLVMATDRRVDVRFADTRAKFTSGIWYVNVPGGKTVATGDVNRDGAVDVVATVSDTHTAEVLLNDGDGFLGSAQTLSNVIPARKIKLLDVNGDARLDLVAGGQNQEEDNVNIWEGTAAGLLATDSVGYETIGAPYDFVLGDVNEDGLLDMVVGHQGTTHHPITDNGPGGVSVMLATAPGQFHEPIRIATPGATNVAITQGADGPTIRAMGEFGNATSTHRWKESLVIDTARDYADVSEATFTRRATVFGDFNEDGVRDAVVADLFNENPNTQVFIGQSDGNYVQTALGLNASWRVNELFVGDFNGDSKDDLGIRVNSGQATSVVSLTSNGDGTFASPRTASLPESFASVQVVDVNGDGREDLVGIEAVSVNTWVVVATADVNGVWTASKDRVPLQNRFVSQLTVADFNQDNQLDVLATSFQSSEIALGVAAQGFGESRLLPLENSFYATGDFNGDGFMDVAAAGFNPVGFAISYGSASGAYETSTRVTLDEPLESAQGIQAIDIHDDGTAEIVVYGNEGFHVLTAAGEAAFSVAEYRVGFFVGSVLAADVTGDANVDLIASPGMGFISSSPIAEVAVLVGAVGGGFESPATSTASFIDGQIAEIQVQGNRVDFLLTHRRGFGKMSGTLDAGVVGDFDGDGAISPADIDLLCSARHDPNLTAADIARFDQNADGQLTAEDVDSWLANIAGARRGDVDLDGDVDFADFLKLSASFGSQEAKWSDGDFDCSGDVGFSDFLLLSSAFGK